MSRPLLAWSALVGVAALGTLFLALDGLHYWHDVRFLFATTQFPLSQVLEGAFNPHQSWGPINEASSGGFYASKVLHLWLLNRVFAWIPPPLGGLRVAVALSVVIVAAAAAGGGVLVRRITASRALGWAAFVSFLLVPLTPYLAGKQLAEVTSLAFTVWGLVLAWAAVQGNREGSIWIESVFAGFLLLLAALCRLDSLFGSLGFFGAAWWLVKEPAPRRRVVRVAALVTVVVSLGYLATLTLTGASLGELGPYLLEFVDAPNRPALMSVLGVASFGGILYPVAVLAAFSRRRRAAGFFLLWWVIAWLPSVTITAAYMIEPRYLVQGLLPFAGLVALGLEVIHRRLPSRWGPSLAWTGVVFILASSWMTIRLMPYELDRPALLSAVDEIEARSPGAAILIPWAYTDFNFLYVMRPSASIYSVHSPTEPGVSAPLVQAWHDRYREWYGGRHLTEPSELQGLMRRGPVYYLGWHRYPPLEFVERMAQRIGFSGLVERLRSIELIDHLDASWVADSRELVRTPAGRVGQYEYYRVRPSGS